MKSLILALLLTSLPCLAQKSTASTRNAATSKDCGSPTVIGSNNNFRFSCGVGQEQAKQIIALLNQLLAKDDVATLIRKLDELAKRTNPNASVVTYDCAGNSRTITLAQGSFDQHVGAEDEYIATMRDLLRAGKWNDLLQECNAQIRDKPEWLTPRLYCAESYMMIGNLKKARQMMHDYDVSNGPAYDDSACSEVAKTLRLRLR